jgi:hypothetical protein
MGDTPEPETMFNSTRLLIESVQGRLIATYRRSYGTLKREYEEIISWAASMALENIATGDGLYHDVEHTILVTLVGQDILHGKHLREGGITPEDWLHFTISHLCHDIGYVKGVCRGDRNGRYSTGVDGGYVELPEGATCAALTPYHVDRGKCFIDERFGGHGLIDAETIKKNIELTRFPVPSSEDHQGTTHIPGLLRASDLIGQLGDPRYINKIPALYWEFEETGINKLLGYENPGQLLKAYPTFYWGQVYPYIKDSIPYLELTQSGKDVLAKLYGNIFVVEHDLLRS